MEDALKSEDIETIETLLLEGFNPNEVEPPLLFQTENKNIIKLLLDYGADPHSTDIYGFTLNDYTNDEEVKRMLNEPRNPTIVSSTKFIKYRGTIKTLKKTNKTRRLRCRVEKSE